jgi:hypothetical protein
MKLWFESKSKGAQMLLDALEQYLPLPPEEKKSGKNPVSNGTNSSGPNGKPFQSDAK